MKRKFTSRHLIFIFFLILVVTSIIDLTFNRIGLFANKDVLNISSSKAIRPTSALRLVQRQVSTDNWQTYSNPAFGLSLKFPRGWYTKVDPITDVNALDLYLYTGQKTSSGEVEMMLLSFGRYSNTSGKSLKQFISDKFNDTSHVIEYSACDFSYPASNCTKVSSIPSSAQYFFSVPGYVYDVSLGWQATFNYREILPQILETARF